MYVEVDEMVRNAFARTDEIHNVEAKTQEDLVEVPLADEVDPIGMDNLMRKCSELVYKGCPINRFQAAVVIMNIMNLYGISNSSFDEILWFLSKDLLLQSNSLPRSLYKIKRMIMRIRLEHKQIECYCQGCILYESKNEHFTKCSKYGFLVYIKGSNEVSIKTLQYFPIIP
jgi:hypothetical protein